MRQVLVDTNVLLSFLTDRNLEQQERAAELFQKAGGGEHVLLVPQVALTEMVYVLLNLYRVSAADVAATLGDLLDMPGVLAVDEVSWPEVLDLWPATVADFGDAVLAAVARQQSPEAVATFDGPFTKRLRRLGLSPYW
jgi:predicted nucleic acid-binding protein